MRVGGVALGTVVVGIGADGPAIIERVLDERALTVRWMIACAVGVVGSAALCMTDGDGAAASSVPAGVALGLVAGATYAGYSWALRRIINRRIPRGAAAGAVLVPVGAAHTDRHRRTHCHRQHSRRRLAGARVPRTGADVRRLRTVQPWTGWDRRHHRHHRHPVEPAVATVLAVLILDEHLASSAGPGWRCSGWRCSSSSRPGGDRRPRITGGTAQQRRRISFDRQPQVLVPETDSC